MHTNIKWTLLFLFTFITLFIKNVSAGRDIFVEKYSGDEVGRYQTYEIGVVLKGIAYTNPYDPDQVDLRCNFLAPSEKKWQIFGYYDNYRGRDNWLVKFTPNETGSWTYYLSVKDSIGEIRSKLHKFDVRPSDRKGWIKVSDDNSNYFEYDDGSTFFGIGMYYPWHITHMGLDELEDAGANLFGYWNITWDAGIIESMQSGLGKYDQRACARIDEIIGWAEERNLKMMLAIWPHDLLAGPLLENTGWNKEWQANPYKTVTTAQKFYSSEVAWKYQEKLYRYILARWGSSSSMGIWEIVNEINGTDGGDNTPQALAWVKRVHNFLKANDPYDRPTTANQSGGRYWTDGYNLVDIPTVHVYENQFNINPFPQQPLRSSYTIYRMVSEYFRKNFKKPAFMGEAGFTAPDNVFGDFTSQSTEYDSLYHNALWVCWASGNAATPLWWDYGSKQVVTPSRLNQLKVFSTVAKKLDYAHIPFTIAKASARHSDVFAMEADTIAVGWIREITGHNLNTDELIIEGLVAADYDITWINPWSGDNILSESQRIKENGLKIKSPENYPETDITFIIKLKK